MQILINTKNKLNTLIMKKLTSLLFILIMLLNYFSFSQSKSIEIYTTLQNASFIPYFNGEKQEMFPVDTFIMEIDTLQNFELLIHFEDENIADLTKKINFNMFKNKKYEIVPTSYFVSTLNDLDGADASDTLIQKFMIKDRTAGKYFKKETDFN